MWVVWVSGELRYLDKKRCVRVGYKDKKFSKGRLSGGILCKKGNYGI